ncbi:MAG: ketose 1,6-bisphosphate aldolase [Spirochaetales bacterium]|nr:ketose 1,6-bisphosphate aldolase [Spirochaetales bacterium]
MALVNLADQLRDAKTKKYAIGAFNMVNLEFLTAVIEAAEKARSPVILNLAEVHMPYVDTELLSCAAVRAAERSAVPVVLNLDHGLSFDTVKRVVDLGFTSVMFDGSSLSYEDNLARTAEIVRYCHDRGVSVEAELGAVGGDEGGALFSEADPSLYTDPEQAGAYVRETGVDALAVAIGNSHGRYKGEPQLDFARLAALRDRAGVPLVLHGGSGIGREDFQRAISLGITKINFYTGMSQAALDSLKTDLASSGKSYNDIPLIFQSLQKRVGDTVSEQIDIFLNGRQPL